MSLLIGCSECGNTQLPLIRIPNGQQYCQSCFSKQTAKNEFRKPRRSKPQMMEQWICTTHHCGSYYPGLVSKHKCPECIELWCKHCKFVERFTFGIQKPKTFGRINEYLELPPM